MKPQPKRLRARIWWETDDGRSGVYEDAPNNKSVPVDKEGNEDWFIWDYGNYSCDCNRSIFFLGLGQGEPDDSWPCSHGVRRIRILKREVIR